MRAPRPRTVIVVLSLLALLVLPSAPAVAKSRKTSAQEIFDALGLPPNLYTPLAGWGEGGSWPNGDSWCLPGTEGAPSCPQFRFMHNSDADYDYSKHPTIDVTILQYTSAADAEKAWKLKFDPAALSKKTVEWQTRAWSGLQEEVKVYGEKKRPLGAYEEDDAHPVPDRKVEEKTWDWPFSRYSIGRNDTCIRVVERVMVHRHLTIAWTTSESVVREEEDRDGKPIKKTYHVFTRHFRQDAPGDALQANQHEHYFFRIANCVVYVQWVHMLDARWGADGRHLGLFQKPFPPEWEGMKKKLAEMAGGKVPLLPEEKKPVKVRLEVASPDHEPYAVDLELEPDKAVTRISGRVTDRESKKGVPGAKVTVAGPAALAATTGPDGSYILTVPGKGTGEADLSRDPILVPRPKVRIRVVLDDGKRHAIPVPGKCDLDIEVTRADAAGVYGPYEKAQIVLSLVEDPKKLPPVPRYLTIARQNATADADGKFRTELTVRKPTDQLRGFSQDYIDLKDMPIRLKLRVQIRDLKGDVRPVVEEFEFPFDVCLLHGVTVGPDMKPRGEDGAPECSRAFHLASQKSTDSKKGDFWVLMALASGGRSHARKGFLENHKLTWPSACRIPLQFPLDLAGPLPAGSVHEVGKVDVLTPEEHETRLKGVVVDFVGPALRASSHFKASALERIRRLPFRYDGPPGSSISYGQGFVRFPRENPALRAEDFWATSLMRNRKSAGAGQSPDYVVCLHEIGHFVHELVVEDGYVDTYATATHKTWTPPDSEDEVVRRHTSFSEATAELFAGLAFTHWESWFATITESAYYYPGYLPDFQSDAKADSALARYSGTEVEGIQTRFVRAHYGTHPKKNPQSVVGDYLTTMWLHRDIGGSPARTICQWVRAKHANPKRDRLGSGAVLARAARYRCIEPPAKPSVTPTWPRKSNALYLEDRAVDFKGQLVRGLPLGKPIEVREGEFSIDLSDADAVRVLVVAKGAKFSLESRARVRVDAGRVHVTVRTGKIELVTPVVRLVNQGTVFEVAVEPGGRTEVRTHEGLVTATADDGTSLEVESGFALTAGADGSLPAPVPFEAAPRLPPDDREDFPFAPVDTRERGDYDGDGKIASVDALAALRMAAGSLAEDLVLDMDGDGRVTRKDAEQILGEATQSE